MKTTALHLVKSGLIIAFLLTQNVYGQNTEEATDGSGIKFGVASVYSPDSFSAWGTIKNSSSLSLRGQVWHSAFDLWNVKARLGSELILTHQLNYPLNGISGPKDSRMGIGIIPVHLQIPLSKKRQFTPFSFVSAGTLFLNDKVPEIDGASVNYLLNLGVGVNYQVFGDVSMQFGYSIQHMSNANTGSENPGIDSHAFFISIILP